MKQSLFHRDEYPHPGKSRRGDTDGLKAVPADPGLIKKIVTELLVDVQSYEDSPGGRDRGRKLLVHSVPALVKVRTLDLQGNSSSLIRRKVPIIKEVQGGGKRSARDYYGKLFSISSGEV